MQQVPVQMQEVQLVQAVSPPPMMIEAPRAVAPPPAKKSPPPPPPPQEDRIIDVTREVAVENVIEVQKEVPVDRYLQPSGNTLNQSRHIRNVCL